MNFKKLRNVDYKYNMSNINKEINNMSEEQDALKKELSQICKKNKRFWEEFGNFYAHYYMCKHATKKGDIWECEQDLFDDDDEEDILSVFNITYSEDSKVSLEVLKAIYDCDFKNAMKILKSLDTGPREWVIEILIDIDKRFEEFIF